MACFALASLKFDSGLLRRLVSYWLSGALSSLSAPCFHQVLEFIHKLTDILKFQVHGSEPHVRDFIQSLETRHHHLAYFGRRPLAIRRFGDISLYVVHNLFESVRGNRPLFTSL